MRTETETKTIYVSDDGKRRSNSKSEIETYENMQLQKTFEKRTIVDRLAPFTTLYELNKEDLKLFRKYNSYVDTEVMEYENGGYYVYVQDADYDHIGEDETLYNLKYYETMVNQKIRCYQRILDDITDSIRQREEQKWEL